ncbi:hypothetical protein H5410_009546 [Solanum commersonii]|uniref:Uncharacterized protein n=1 Tax=Solanum commersonii TaxID=4109 RepID=A0A9J6AIA9_SOLCO|nr:hypothetical protein H5410_009546 [Solanum commersonii]
MGLKDIERNLNKYVLMYGRLWCTSYSFKSLNEGLGHSIVGALSPILVDTPSPTLNYDPILFTF